MPIRVQNNRMRKSYLSLLLIIISLFTGMRLHAQTDLPNGLDLDDEAYEQLSFPADQEDIRGDELPPFFSLISYAPLPGDQGQKASCVAWALAHALTICKAIRLDITKKEQIDAICHSEAYIYNQLKSGAGCHTFLTFTQGFELLKSKGDCLASDFSHEKYSCDDLPQPIHHLQAGKYRISDYLRLTGRRHSADQKIDFVRNAIAHHQPVVVGMYVPADFRYAKTSAVDWGKARSPHAMVVVGYNDFSKTFTLMNSYGKDWGDRGFFEISYDSFAKSLIYSHTIVLGDDFGGSGN